MSRFGIVRYLPDGRLDDSFGDGGAAVIEWEPASFTTVRSFDIKVQADNGVLVAGAYGQNVGIASVGPDGRVRSRPGVGETKSVSTFMTGQSFPVVKQVLIAQRVGLFAGGAGGAAEGAGAIAALPGAAGAGAVAAHAGAANPQARAPGAPAVLAIGDVGEAPSPRFAAVARFRTDGSPDTAFSADGQLLQSLGMDEIEVHTASYNPRDGKCVVLARGDVRGLPMVRGVRFLENGSRDQTFGLNDAMLADIWTSAAHGPWHLAPRDSANAGGDIVIVAEAFLQGVGRPVAVFKVSSAGNRVPGFGVDGGVGFIPVAEGIGEGRSVSIDARSRIMVAGESRGDFGIERFLPNGTADAGFGQGGLVRVAFPGTRSAANAAIIDSAVSERIIVAGEADGQFALARLAENGAPDLSFGTNGTVRTAIGQFGAEATEIAVDGEQRIIAVGNVALAPPID